MVAAVPTNIKAKHPLAIIRNKSDSLFNCKSNVWIAILNGPDAVFKFIKSTSH